MEQHGNHFQHLWHLILIWVVCWVLEVVLSVVNYELASICGEALQKFVWQPMRWPCNGSKFLWTGPWACWAANHPLHQWPSEKGRSRVRQFGLVASSWCILIENDEIADSLLLSLTVKMLHSCRCRSPKKSTKKVKISAGIGDLSNLPEVQPGLAGWKSSHGTGDCWGNVWVHLNAGGLLWFQTFWWKKQLRCFWWICVGRNKHLGPPWNQIISLENWWLEDGISC